MTHIAIAFLKSGAQKALIAPASLGVAGHHHHRALVAARVRARKTGRKVASGKGASVRSGSHVTVSEENRMARRRRRQKKGHRKAHRTPRQIAAAKRNLKKARAALRRKRRRH